MVAERTETKESEIQQIIDKKIEEVIKEKKSVSKTLKKSLQKNEKKEPKCISILFLLLQILSFLKWSFVANGHRKWLIIVLLSPFPKPAI